MASPRPTPERTRLSHDVWHVAARDDKLMESLIDVYFAWQHPVLPSFSESRFRDDLMAGRIGCCSSALVNAICASACLVHAPDDLCLPRSKTAVAFYELALNQMNKSDSPITLVSVAVLNLLSYVAAALGRLSEMWNLSGRSSLSVIDMGLHLCAQRQPQDGQGDDDDDHDDHDENRLVNAGLKCFWVTFGKSTLSSLVLGRAPIVIASSVAVSLPEIDQRKDQEPWQAVPLPISRKHGFQSTCSHYDSKLAIIINGMLLLFHAPSTPLTVDLILAKYEQFASWRASLPKCLQKTRGAPAHVICLHLGWHAAVVTLFRPFIKYAPFAEGVTPRQICLERAKSIALLWEHHEAQFGYLGIHLMQMYALLNACTVDGICMQEAAPAKRFVDACNAFQRMSSGNHWAVRSLRNLREIILEEKVELPDDAHEALWRDFDRQAAG